MIRMSEELINSEQNLINYLNADNIFKALEQILMIYGRDFILKEEHETKEECVESYVARSNAMRFACDAIEHYAKAILIQNGHTWDESKSWGHNLLDLFNNLDEESRSLVISTLSPLTLNIFDFSQQQNLYEKEMICLINLFAENSLLEESPEELVRYYLNNNTAGSVDNNDNLKPVVLLDGNITRIKPEQTVDGELEKLNSQSNPGKPRQPLFGIKSRFPGQYLVEGNAEFLISLAYTFNKISCLYREREEKIRHI